MWQRWVVPQFEYNPINPICATGVTPCHIDGMVEYKLLLNGIAAFVVEITQVDGSRSERRFPTEAEALLWIAEQGPIDDAAETEEAVSDARQGNLGLIHPMSS